ncbi:DUF3472 domain-containing protein [Algoriphagus halophytocola]|uniref:DUF3472 domain-containing protein n=1 Tax=Algoriphagus halophytocola TaxID=2991499 RepID=A0ABY6MM91_9BACT|nr:DUF3472 domain-containing protein [Algoriphagus sp. TR-M5]UZD23426.1 DUF3472 domain-containing protein [Algoriphagus sp. TR-M5]
MKTRISLLFLTVLALIQFSANPLFSQSFQALSIPLGGNAFQSQGAKQEKISTDGIASWTEKDSEFSVYFKSSIRDSLTLNLALMAQSHASTIALELNGKSQVLEINPGQARIVSAGKFQIIEGYNTLRLNGLEKSGDNFAKIKSIELLGETNLEFDFVKDNENNRFYWGRRGPSVHLTYQLPEDRDFQWFYNEVTVPQGLDPIGSYFMANGFAEGYFGIQVNSAQERRILFSVWSPFKTDNPKEIPEAEKIKLLKKGERVYTGEFGNEGSGGQSYLVYPWKAGETYSFLNSVKPDGQGNTIYTAYFKDPELGEWILIASFLRPKTDTWYQRPHSFLENFIPESGHLERTARYANQWARDREGNWLELTEAKFTGDDIARRGYRQDFEGGAKSAQFYLRNGGFFNRSEALNSLHKRPAVGKHPEIDFSKLP